MGKKEKKSEYRIRVAPHLDWGIAYFVEQHKYFLWIWYWKKMSQYWVSSQYTVYRRKSSAEELIEQYKNGKKKELENDVVWYY